MAAHRRVEVREAGGIDGDVVHGVADGGTAARGQEGRALHGEHGAAIVSTWRCDPGDLLWVFSRCRLPSAPPVVLNAAEDDAVAGAVRDDVKGREARTKAVVSKKGEHISMKNYNFLINFKGKLYPTYVI